MTTVLIRRFLELIPTLIGVSIIAFLVMKLTPGDPVKLMLGPLATPEQIELKRKELHFDKPLAVQYVYYMGELLSGKQRSIVAEQTVIERIGERLPATLELAVFSMFFALLTSVIVGVLSAVKPHSLFDNTTRLVVFVFLAMPSFWLGLELIILFSRNLEIFPPADRGEGSIMSHVSHLILPSITLGVGTGAFLCRILRSSMLEVLHTDCVRTARAKGLDETRVILKHALKNAMIPFVTVAGISTGSLLGGSVIVETVFDWPGVGELIVTSITERDFPVTMGCVLVLSVIFVLVNLFVDITYMFLDPRIRLDAKAD